MPYSCLKHIIDKQSTSYTNVLLNITKLLIKYLAYTMRISNFSMPLD